MALNLGKIWEEATKFGKAWWSGAETATHKSGRYVNRFVEGAKASPQTAGRLLSFLFPILVIQGVVIWRIW